MEVMEPIVEIQEVVEIHPLQALIGKLDAQNIAKEDIVIGNKDIQYQANTEKGQMLMIGQNLYRPTEIAHTQISEKLEIPRAYYNKMRVSHPELLEQNINMWLSKKEKTKFLLRTFKYADADNVCRAMLSNRYNILDNYDVLFTALEAIQKTGIHVEIIKADITDSKMYLHIVAPEIHVEATELLDGYLANRSTAKTGSGIISGLTISNSEVGMGTFEIAGRAQILQCQNGLHDRNAKFRQVHLGARMDEGHIQWSNTTKSKNYELIMSQVQDSVKVYLSKDYLGQLTDKLQRAKEQPIDHPTVVIETLSNTIGIPDSHRAAILNYYIKDNDHSALGILNATTRATQSMGADSQNDIEAAAFSILPKIKSFDKPHSAN